VTLSEARMRVDRMSENLRDLEHRSLNGALLFQYLEGLDQLDKAFSRVELVLQSLMATGTPR
jgi:hypothetical protein